mgnify:FL=1
MAVPSEVGKVKPDIVVCPDIFVVPSTINPSFILIEDESLELNVVPFIVISPTLTLPVPEVVSVRSPFDGAEIVDPVTAMSPNVFNVSE